MSDFSKEITFIRNKFPNQEFIPLHEPRFIGNERKYVLDAIDSTFVSSVGAYVDRFEKMMAEIGGAKFAVATVNGTSALHMALMMAGVNRGDLVISQSLTFIATCNAISYIGAAPAFVDVDLDTMGMSPQALKNWLEENTTQRLDADTNRYFSYHKTTKQKVAAVVPMHTFGHPCRIDELQEIAQHYHVTLVEDAAESLGSLYKGKPTGSFGKLGTFSFNGNKTVTCGGGGAIVTDDENLARLAKHLTTQAKVPHKWEFNHDLIGYNYRMPNLNAAFACAQLEQLEAYVVNKRELADAYRQYFENDKKIEFKKETEGARANYWLCSLSFPDLTIRNKFLEATNAEGVMTRPVWTPMHELSMFRECMKGDLKNSEYLAERLVNIPSSVRIH